MLKKSNLLEKKSRFEIQKPLRHREFKTSIQKAATVRTLDAKKGTASASKMVLSALKSATVHAVKTHMDISQHFPQSCRLKVS